MASDWVSKNKGSKNHKWGGGVYFKLPKSLQAQVMRHFHLAEAPRHSTSQLCETITTLQIN